MAKNQVILNEDDDDFDEEWKDDVLPRAFDAAEEINTEFPAFEEEAQSEEQTAKTEEAQSEEKTSEADENNDVQIQTITSIDDVEPLLPEQFYEQLVTDLFQAKEGSEKANWLDEQLKSRFGRDKERDYLLAEIIKPEHNEEILEIVESYFSEKIEGFKDNAFSLNADVVNSNFTDFKNFTHVSVSDDNLPDNIEYQLYKRRIGKIKALDDTFEVLRSGIDLFNMIASNSNSVPTQIEAENNVQKIEDFYINNILNQEQIAMGYHNVAIIFERLAERKRSTTLQKNAIDYMRKALSLTSNPRLIKTCYEYLPDKVHNKMVLVKEACDRVLQKPDNAPSVLFRIHSLYSKALIDSENRTCFSQKDGNIYKEAIYHYRQAFQFAGTRERQAKILRNIANLQRNSEPQEYIKTRARLAEKFLEGKTKVRELLSLSEEVKNQNMKMLFLESAANELIDTTSLKSEERSLLLKNVFNRLRAAYPPENSEKLKNLEKLERKYCTTSGKDEEMLFVRISSKGRDYFD